MRIDELPLTARAVNALRSIGVCTTEDLERQTRVSLLRARGLGKKTLFEIETYPGYALPFAPPPDERIFPTKP